MSIQHNSIYMNVKKFVFVVQGEGRGHLTQAIATYEMLVAQGHIVSAVIIGSNKCKEVPAFVKTRIKAPVITISSPHFIKDKHNRAISVTRSVLYALRNLRKYYHSLCFIRDVIYNHRPDIIINFYEPLVAIASAFYTLPVKVISVAHQYLYLHPDFAFPRESNKRDQWLVKFYTRLTAFRSEALLALSFYPMQRMQHDRIKVCAPLLRQEIAQQEIYKGKYILVYLVNAGYMKNIIEWHKQHPETEIHCFTDSPAVKGKWDYSECLHFHSLDDRKFLYYMANAAGLATTAGFESVCEAMYMGKPVMMVPVENHFEQWCNARDAASCGAGIYADYFDLTLLKEYIIQHPAQPEKMKSWAAQSEIILLQTIYDLFEENSVIITAPINSVESFEGRAIS